MKDERVRYELTPVPLTVWGRPLAMRCKLNSIDERDALVERLREFIRFNYVTPAEVARRIGVRDSTIYSWLKGFLNRGTVCSHSTRELQEDSL